MDGSSQWSIGRHTFRWEAPHLLWVKLEGDNTREEAREMVDLYQRLGEQGPYFILADSGAAGVLEPEARRVLSERMRPEWFHHIIFYNSRLLHRAMAKGLILAAELFHAVPKAHAFRGRLHFVATREQALALMERLSEPDERVRISRAS